MTAARIAAVSGWRREGASVALDAENAAIRFTFLDDGVLHARFRPSAEHLDDPCWATRHGRAHPAAGAHAWNTPDGRHLTFTVADAKGAARVSLHVATEPFAWAVRDGENRLLAETRPNGVALGPSAARLRLAYPWWEQTFGCGEKTGPLDKQGQNVVMWNTDEPFYEPWSDPLYKSVPFWIGLKGGTAYGILVDEPGRSVLDFGRTERETLTVRTERAALDVYVFAGPRPADVLRRYTEVTGRPLLPPRWALGYHQCRYSYTPDTRVLALARNFRERHIPCDGIYLDIDHMDRFRSFTWHPEAFPDPAGLMKELHGMGFRVVTITDPGLARGDATHAAGAEGGHFVTDASGTVIEGEVWPGTCAFPDFLAPATHTWWGTLFSGLVDLGVDGFWVDMNEPSIRNDRRTLPDDALHRTSSGTLTHGDVHNLYGDAMAAATRDGVAALRPDRRPFVLTRAAYAGTQACAASWSGDNRSSWEHVGLSLRMALNMAVSGYPLYGPDIGGFAGRPPAELFTRWLQLAGFFGLMRTHTCVGTADQEPWSYGQPWEDHNRRIIEDRYRLLPYHYSLIHRAHETGTPPLRPLWYEHPDAYDLAQVEDQFLFGPDLMAAPVLEPERRWRGATLPPGTWFDFEDGTRFGEEDPRRVAAHVPLDRMALFARGGAIIPLQEPIHYADAAPDPTLTVRVFPGAEGTFTLIEDAGDGPAAGPAPTRRTRFEVHAHERLLAFSAFVEENGYPSPFTHLHVVVMGIGAAPVSGHRDGRSMVARESTPAPDDAASFHFEGGHGRLHAMIEVASLPAVLEFDFDEGVLAPAGIPRRLEVARSGTELVLGVPRHLMVPELSEALPAEACVTLRWDAKALYVDASMRPCAGGLFTVAEASDGDGLSVHLAAGVRVTAGPDGRVRVHGAPADGVTGTIDTGNDGVHTTLTLPAAVLGMERLTVDTVIPFNVALRHSDGSGRCAHVAWLPPAADGEPPAGALRLAPEAAE